MGTVNFSSRALRFPKPKLPITLKARIFPHTAKIYGVYNKKGKAFSFTLSCTLNTAKGKKGGKKKVVLPDSERAPPLNGGAPVSRRPAVRRSNDGGVGLLGTFPKRVFSGLSNLQLAIAEIFAVAGLMALGTIIDQGEVPEFYIQKLHMFSSPILLGTLALLGASLMTFTDQSETPLLKVSKRWSFLNSNEESISEQEYAETLPKTSVQDLGATLMGTGYDVFLKGPLYAFKGLAGRISPIVLNLALVLVMSGGTLSASVGDEHDLAAVFSSTPSDLSGAEVRVNDPLKSSGITIYKTDQSLNLAIARPLKTNGDKMVVFKFAPVEDSNSSSNLKGTEDAGGSPNANETQDASSPNVNKTEDVKGISTLATDSQSIIIYHKEGKVVGVRQPKIETDGTKIVVVDANGSTSLDLKIDDPGVKIVYAGFGALMLMNCINYLSQAEIWALQDGRIVVIGGKTNTAKGEFPDAIIRLLDQVPEIVESSSSSSTESDDNTD